MKAVVTKHFSHADCTFNFVNATALWKQVQTRPSKKKPLKWAVQSLSTPEGQIGLVRLADYYEFLQESNARQGAAIAQSAQCGVAEEIQPEKEEGLILQWHETFCRVSKIYEGFKVQRF